jgi:hypothetical protein
MENTSRDLAHDSKVKSPDRWHKVPKCWTLLLVGDLGKIATFHIGKPLFIGLIASLSVILAVVIYSVVSYSSVRLENRRLRKDLDTLRAELETSEKAKEKALVSSMVLKDGVKQTDRRDGPTSDRETKDVVSKVRTPSRAATNTAEAKAPETPSPAPTNTAEAKAPETPSPAPTNTAEAKASETSSPAPTASQPTRAEKDNLAPPVSAASILVKNFEIWQMADGNAFKFRFALKNVDHERGRIAGHTFIVLRPEEGSQEPVRAFPWSPLQDGKPAIFKKGQYFSITSFKFVSGTLTDVSTIKRFKTATVYVYSDTGDPLVEEVFEVGDILRS